MGDDLKKSEDPKKLKENSSSSGTSAEDEELRQLMVGLLEKMKALDAVTDRLARVEATQQELLHARAPEFLHLRKDGPMGHTRFHKLDFPTYDGGGDPLPFLNRCEHYFRGQRTVEEEKVWLAVLHLQGKAQQWYMRLEQDEGTPGWRRFSELLDQRFGPPIRSNPLGELISCLDFDKLNDKKIYNDKMAYGQSKLANLLHAKELSRRLKEEGANITVNSVHPGLIMTNLMRHSFVLLKVIQVATYILWKNVPQGAATTCYVGLNPQMKGVTGKYFADCNVEKTSKLSRNDELAKQLWDFSEELIKSAQ